MLVLEPAVLRGGEDEARGNSGEGRGARSVGGAFDVGDGERRAASRGFHDEFEPDAPITFNESSIE